MLISALSHINKKDIYHFSLNLSVFGIILFLLMWETRSRYILNYIPIFILLATYAIDYIYLNKTLILKKPLQIKEKIKNNKKRTK